MRLGNFYQISPNDWLFPEYVIGASNRAVTYSRQHQSLNGVERSNEEFVRQWALAQILQAYHYPVEWLGEQITIEEPVWIGSFCCRADIAIKNRQGDPIIFVETKSYGVSDYDFQKAEQQLKSYLSATYTAILGIVTDGSRVTVLQKRLDRHIFETVTDLPILEEALKQDIFTNEDVEPVQADMEEPNVTVQEEPDAPTTEDYQMAFLSLSPYITDNQRVLLKAHYNSQHKTVTMTELAQAVGYNSFQGANFQYGKLAGLLCDFLNWHYGVKVNILATFISPQRANGNQWQLVMRPEVSNALEAVQWI